MPEHAKRKLLVTAKTMSRVLDEFLQDFENAGWEVLCTVPEGQSFSASELVALVPGCDAMIVGDDDLSLHFFNLAPARLRLVVKWGVGTDTIDQAAAESAGVLVRNTPGMFGAEIADLAFGYVLALARNIVPVHQGVLAGAWPQPEGTTLAGKTIAIVGLGDAGTNLATRAEAFGMQVVFHDPYQDATTSWRSVSLMKAFEEGDFVVLTCPSTEETRGLASQPMLGRMKKNAYLVNVARGDLVNEKDLLTVLESEQIAGAALDVFQQEPLPGKSTLRKFANLILGAHNGSNTREGLVRASQKACQIVVEWGRGELA